MLGVQVLPLLTPGEIMSKKVDIIRLGTVVFLMEET
jgi:hypothetical protein